MATRFKNEKHCISRSWGQELDCYWESVPIRDWHLDPSVQTINWASGNPIPSSSLFTVTFPDVEGLEEYRNITTFRYAIEMASTTPFAKIVGVTTPTNITLPQDGKVRMQVAYNDFDSLEQGDTDIIIHCKVFGMKKLNSDVFEEELESRNIKITIKKGAVNNSPYLTVDKSEYRMTYNIATDTLSGDTDIRWQLHNPPPNIVEGSIKQYYAVRTNVPTYIESSERKTGTALSGIFPTKIQEKPKVAGRFTFKMVQYYTYHNGVAWSGRNELPVYFTIQLDVIQDIDGIEVDKRQFDFTLKHHENKKATGVINVTNSNNLTLKITQSEWIKPTLSGNKISFETLEAQSLTTGVNNGYIRIEAEGKTIIVSVVVRVEQTVISELSDMLFCLDGKSVTVNKQSLKATRLRMRLTMIFAGYGKSEETIVQEYDYIFFKEKVTLYPGEDVQDFFTELDRLEDIRINEGEIPMSYLLFKACKTVISVSELEENEAVINTFDVGTFYFIPGKKPKAYPYLTNGVARRTFTQSLISISAMQNDFVGRQLGELAGNLIDNSNAKNPEYIVNMSFRRFVADRTYGDRDIISKGNLSLHPLSNPQEVIDVIFQNQNFCPDWFSFIGEWELHSELTHTISENIRNGTDAKSDTKRKDTIMLNTGFILEEEVELLTELLESPLCFAKIKNKWRRLMPISKKSIVYSNMESIRTFVVEFQEVRS